MFSRVLSFQTSGSLSAVQLETSQKSSFSFISGSLAIKSGQVEVVETSEAGSVNNLFVINHSKEFVFFMDGDILSGAKQNRVLNTSVLLAPESKSVIPVSCVERGRWQYKSDKFGSTTYSAPTKLRADKASQISSSLNDEKGHYANQSSVWNNVSSYSEMHHVKSNTACLSDIYDRKEKDFESFLNKFTVKAQANVLALFSGKRLMSIDAFGLSDIYEEYFPKLLKGAALETFGARTGENELSEAEAYYKAQSLLDKFEEMQSDEHKGAGVGIEKRFNTEELTGFELSYNNNLIHQTALAKKL